MAIAELLGRETRVELVIAGRDERKAMAAAERLNAGRKEGQVSGIRADAADRSSLARALEGAAMVVVASSTIEHCSTVAEAALDAGADYYDLQLSSRRKLTALKALEARIESAGRCFITDGGYHPGLPAALIRYASLGFDEVHSAVAASVMRLPWRRYRFSDASLWEFMEEIRDHRPQYFEKGRWTENWSESRVFDFGPPFGKRRCAPMRLEELTTLPDEIPALRETGFFANSFDGLTSNVVLPLGFLTVNLFPRLSRQFGKILLRSMTAFAKPPFGVVMIVESQGKKDGQPKRTWARLAHEDSYVFTAAPVVACLRQYLSGAIRRDGLHFQGNLVEPAGFVRELERLGLRAVTSEARSLQFV
jgi:saccharopine dehydrogenase (NAD+, L-lysine-forming)